MSSALNLPSAVGASDESTMEDARVSASRWPGDLWRHGAPPQLPVAERVLRPCVDGVDDVDALLRLVAWIAVRRGIHFNAGRHALAGICISCYACRRGNTTRAFECMTSTTGEGLRWSTPKVDATGICSNHGAAAAFMVRKRRPGRDFEVRGVR